MNIETQSVNVTVELGIRNEDDPNFELALKGFLEFQIQNDKR